MKFKISSLNSVVNSFMMSFPIASLFAWETHIFKHLGKNKYSIIYPSDISKLLDCFLLFDLHKHFMVQSLNIYNKCCDFLFFIFYFLIGR